MIQYFDYRDGLKHLPQFAEGCWVNVTAPLSHSEIKELHKVVNIPMDFLGDTMDRDERSRYETDDDLSMIIVRTPYENKVNPEEENAAFYITVPISIIVIKRTVVTIDYFSNLSAERSILHNLRRKFFKSPAALILHLFEENTNSFMAYLKEVNDKTSQFEAKLFRSNKNEELMNLLKMQKSLVYFVTSLRTNENLFMKLSRSPVLHMDEDEKDYMMDIVVDTSQALEMSNVYTNILSSTLDSYVSIIANNQNEVLRKLSIITLVVTFPTLVASILGMNVPIPHQHSDMMFYVAIGFSFVTSSFVGWLMLKRKVL